MTTISADPNTQPKTYPTYKEIFIKAYKKWFHAFAVGYASRSLLSLLVRIFSILKSGSFSNVFSVNQLVSEKNLIVREEAVRLGLFLGCFSGGFNLVKDLLEKIRKKEDGVNSIIAGGIAGLSVFSQTRDSWRTISLYTFARLLQCMYNGLKERNYFQWTNSFTHGDTILFALSSAQIMYAYVMRPNTLPKSYFDFIVNTSPIHRTVLEVVRLNNREMPFDVQKITAFCKNKGTILGNIEFPYPQIGCNILHPQTHGCVKHNVNVFIDTAKKILPLYASLTVVPTLVFQFGTLMKAPLQTILGLVKSTTRSVSFLASFVTLYMSVVCTHRNLFSTENKYLFWFAGLICSSSIMLEKKSRRSELALYTLPRALDSLYMILNERKWLGTVPNGELYLFMLSMAGLMYYYDFERSTMSNLIASLAKYLL